MAGKVDLDDFTMSKLILCGLTKYLSKHSQALQNVKDAQKQKIIALKMIFQFFVNIVNNVLKLELDWIYDQFLSMIKMINCNWFLNAVKL